MTKREPFHLPEKDRRQFRLPEDEKSLSEPNPVRWMRRKQGPQGTCSVDAFAERLILEAKLNSYKDLRIALDKAAEAGVLALEAFRYSRQERNYTKTTLAALQAVSALRGDPHFMRALKLGKEVFKRHKSQAVEHLAHFHSNLTLTPISMLIREMKRLQESLKDKKGFSGHPGHVYRDAVILSLTRDWLRWTGKLPAKKKTEGQKEPSLRSLFHDFIAAALFDLGVIQNIKNQVDSLSYSIRKAITGFKPKKVRKPLKKRK